MSDDVESSEPRGDDVLVPEFVLDLLTPSERVAFVRRLAADPGLRRAVRQWQARFERLDDDFAETSPPAAAWPGIQRRLFGTSARAGSSWWNSLTLWRGLTASALAVAVVAVSLSLMRPAPVDPQEFAVQLVAALQAQQGSGVEFVAFYDSSSGSVRLMGLSGEAFPDKDYELWYISGDDPAVSMGVVPVDQRKEIALDDATRQKFGEGTMLAVTLEQKGGSPTGVRQGPIVALGPALKI